MINLSKLQEEIQIWRRRNFPCSNELEQFLGMVEELGELSHTILKSNQKIREIHIEEEKDAIGDLLIYLLSYCAERGFNADSILSETWLNVSKRNWINFPKNGLTE